MMTTSRATSSRPSVMYGVQPRALNSAASSHSSGSPSLQPMTSMKNSVSGTTRTN
jgi:hypothetical protein